jgi:hypothetical protein
VTPHICHWTMYMDSPFASNLIWSKHEDNMKLHAAAMAVSPSACLIFITVIPIYAKDVTESTKQYLPKKLYFVHIVTLKCQQCTKMWKVFPLLRTHIQLRGTEAVSHPAVQTLYPLLWNPKFHCMPKNLPPVPILSEKPAVLLRLDLLVVWVRRVANLTL